MPRVTFDGSKDDEDVGAAHVDDKTLEPGGEPVELTKDQLARLRAADDRLRFSEAGKKEDS